MIFKAVFLIGKSIIIKTRDIFQKIELNLFNAPQSRSLRDRTLVTMKLISFLITFL